MVEINENENKYYTDDYDSEYELYEAIRNKPQSSNFDDNSMVVEPSTTTIPEPVTVTPVRKTKITRQPS
ncbi:23829_t:CDS:2, partial [Dentiscutata erythropus]